MASYSLKETLRGHAAFFISGTGEWNCLNDPQRNFNDDADVSKAPETTCEFEDQSKLDNWPYPACNISSSFSSYMPGLAS